MKKKKEKKGIIEIQKSVSHCGTPEGVKERVTYWSRHIDTNLKSYNITKMLGGKTNVIISRWKTYHGYGGWVYEHAIQDIEVAKQSLTEQGWNYVIYRDIYNHGCFMGKEILETTVKNNEDDRN